MALAWGKIEVEGIGTFRDAKLFPGGAKEWDWRETGTEHLYNDLRKTERVAGLFRTTC